MSSSGVLHTPENYHKAWRTQIAALYSGYKLEVKSYCPENTTAFSNVSKSFPGSAAPLFESTDGVNLFDANAIAYFVGNAKLRGEKQEALVTQWVNFADLIVLPAVGVWVYPILGAASYDKGLTAEAKENITAALKFADEYLANRTYLVSEHVTQADITLFTAVYLLFVNVLDEQFRSSIPHVTRWFNTISHQQEVEKVVGTVQLCTVAKTYDPKTTQPTPKKAKGQKQNPKPKQDKKSAPVKEKPKGDDEHEDDAPKEKASNPLAILPAGTFNLEEYKRIYSNNDVKTVGVPALWEKFDPSAYSIWFCEYKYPEELKLLFMTGNLISGFFARMEVIQKFAFASMCIFGENNNSTISGVWIWRGTGLAFDLSKDLQYDCESYDWKKLDHTSEADKKLVAEYFAQEGGFDGKVLAEGYVFK